MAALSARTAVRGGMDLLAQDGRPEEATARLVGRDWCGSAGPKSARPEAVTLRVGCHKWSELEAQNGVQPQAVGTRCGRRKWASHEFRKGVTPTVINGAQILSLEGEVLGPRDVQPVTAKTRIVERHWNYSDGSRGFTPKIIDGAQVLNFEQAAAKEQPLRSHGTGHVVVTSRMFDRDSKCCEAMKTTPQVIEGAQVLSFDGETTWNPADAPSASAAAATSDLGGDRHVAGIRWGKDTPPITKVIPLAVKEAELLRCAGRLDRISLAGSVAVKIAGGGPTRARAMLTHPVRCGNNTRLILTGPPQALESMLSVVSTMLGWEGDGVCIPMHPYDTASLRKPTRRTVADMELVSGCRLVVEDQQKMEVSDDILTSRTHRVQLLGDKPSQQRAMELLSPRLSHSPITDQHGHTRAIGGFEASTLGPNLKLDSSGTILRQLAWGGRAPLKGLVASGDGELLPFHQGCFFCLGIRAVDRSRRPQGGTRLGVTQRLPADFLPETLLTKPRQCWVVGRGFVRGPDLKSRRLLAADIDVVDEGDELGLLVTRREGSLVLFRRSNRFADWSCFMHWEAGIENSMHCHVLVELSGVVQEIEYLHGRMPPDTVVRDVDEPSMAPRL
eukprot:TRINITY_DN22707_c0_g1_i1.p1 TRINITY_DN22707_c0_g1~~TRINITY_DN22707_c0_g1_i1.p1  ORF type:complete len:615 (-),score=71.13 TRINITY_DN22707_c0_g1_i1:630-2474(-)